MCPPEMLGFHDTLEMFFRKNFTEEIHRLTFDGPAEMHPAVSGTRSRKPSEATPYQAAQQRSLASDAISIAPSSVSVPHARIPAYAIPPLPSRSSVLSTSTMGTLESGPSGVPRETPLQRHLARLTQHGMGALDGATRASDVASLDSPSDSFINGGGTIVGIGVGAGGSSSSIVGSISGSLRGRLSRLGALSFGRGGQPGQPG
jgi:dedicator of cytokinesis protein 3